MPRKTKEELKAIRVDKSVVAFIDSNKYLKDSKYFKNNYWSTAAWDSWAAQGKAGGCACCGVRYYNGTLSNTRARTFKGGRENICKKVAPHTCHDCMQAIETKLGITFKRH